MSAKEITFRAFPIKNIPKYEIIYNETKIFIYNPLLSEFEFRLKNKISYYRLSELVKLSDKKVESLGVKKEDLSHLLSLCRELPLLKFAEKEKLERKVKKKNSIQKNKKVQTKSVPEKKLKCNSGKQPYYRPNNLVYTKIGKKPYTIPEVRVEYDKILRKNIFYVTFCYLVNGVFRPFKINLKKLNNIPDIEERKRRAEKICNRIDHKLYNGITPEKLVSSRNQ